MSSRGGLGLPVRLNIPKEFLARPAKAEFGDAGGLTPRENGAVKPRGGTLLLTNIEISFFGKFGTGLKLAH